MMSNAASKYDVWKLYSGAGIAFLAMISILGTCAAQAAGSISTNSWITSVALIYGAMMFASSYVEEEHHFWYWVTSGMFGWLFFKE